MINLQKGAIYQHPNFGPLEYLRVDEFYGQRTLEFRQVSNGKSRYLLPEAVEKILATVETIETVKQQRDELSQALSILRESFVIAAGDKSPFAKCALAQADAAIAKAKGGEV